MPCNCDGYPAPRTMSPAEQWTTLTKHHIELEKETEALRELCQQMVAELQKVRAMFPGISVAIPSIPIPTKDWSPLVY